MYPLISMFINSESLLSLVSLTIILSGLQARISRYYRNLSTFFLKAVAVEMNKKNFCFVIERLKKRIN